MKKDRVLYAKNVVVDVCDHGTLTISLCDDDGNVFAAAVLPALDAADLLEDALSQCEDWADRALAPDRTQVH